LRLCGRLLPRDSHYFSLSELAILRVQRDCSVLKLVALVATVQLGSKVSGSGMYGPGRSKASTPKPQHCREPTAAALSKGLLQFESHLKRFDGVENVCKCRRGCWRYSGFISVVDIVIATVKQI
jgi:hypothetical protein